MAKDDEDYTTSPLRQPGEGVRIVGAEEAASAIESGQAEGRARGLFGRSGGGDPGAQHLEFPEDEQPGPVTPSRSNPLVAGGGSGPELQHWADPPTGEVPR